MYFQDELHNRTGKKSSLIGTFKAITTQNFESELEKNLK